MPDFPVVSIIIPCYNAQEFLRETLDSALAQTYSALEVVVVDDGSTDGSTSILREYAARHDRFRWQQLEHRGIQKTRNAGLELAWGEYILWLDSDDLLAPDLVAVQMEELRRAPGCIIACPWHKLRLKNGLWSTEYLPYTGRTRETVLRSMLRGEWPQHALSCLFPRAAMLSIGGWDESLLMHEDRKLLSLLLIRNYPIVFSDRSYGLYRIRTGSIALSHSEQVAQSVLAVALSIEQELMESGQLNDYANELAHFLDLYYIDTLLYFPAVAHELQRARQRVNPVYRDLRPLRSRIVRAALGDRRFAQLARLLRTREKR